MSRMLKRNWDNYDSDSREGGKRPYPDRPRRMEGRHVPQKVRRNLYCWLCDSHMNSENVWAQHMSGKRHYKKFKRWRGETLFRAKSLPCNDVSRIQKELDEIEEPVVGLHYICETRRADPSIDPFYNCLLCPGTFTVLTVIEHLLSQKHRMSYLQMEYKKFHQIDFFKLNKSQLFYMVNKKAAKMEEKLGRGTITIKVEKTNGSSLL